MDEKVARRYKQIINDYNKTGKKFVDAEFPANHESIGLLSEHNKSNIKWLRPHEFKHSNDQQEWTVCGDISHSNISQGTLGDCWFLGSIAVVAASKPDLILKLIFTQKWDPAGAYIVRLCKDIVWKTVIVDDLLPCDEFNRPIYAKAKGKQLWVCLLEKAHAKLYGSYHALKSGQAIEGLISLTGFPGQSLRFEKDDNAIDSKRLDVVWQTLFSCSKAGFLIGMVCGRSEVSKEEYETVGLISNHVYSVLQVRSISQLRLMQLRNPWGRHSWKGDWNWSSRLWTPELMEKLKPPEEDDGTFWISLQDVVKADICQIRSSWQESRFEGTFANSVSKSFCYYELLVSKPTEIEYALYQPSRRSLGKNDELRQKEEIQIDMCMILVSLEDTKSDVPKIKRYLGSSPREFSSCVIGNVRDSILKPGAYAIVPFSSISWRSGIENNYALSIHSSILIKTTKKEASLQFLTDSLIAFAVKSGERKDYNENFSFYKRWNWSGALIVAENKHSEKYLRVSCDMRKCENMISSRATKNTNESDSGLQTWDVIPPSSRQILVILTRRPNLSKYSMTYSTRYHHVKESTLEEFAHGIIDGHGKCHLPELVSTFHQPREQR